MFSRIDPSKLRAAALAVLTVVLLLTAAMMFRGSPSAPKPQAAPEPRIATVASRPTADPETPSASEWMERIRNTPASGRPALMRDILAMSDASLRDEISTALATAWMAEDLDDYLAFVDEQLVGEGVTSESMKRFSVALMRSFEASSGKAELSGKIRYVAEAIITYLMANDLAGAEAWAKEHLVKLDLDMALARIAPSMVSVDPAKAMEIYAGIAAVAPRLSSAAEMGAALVKHDPGAAVAWANSIHAHSERTLAMSGVVSEIADTDAVRAAALLKDFLEKIQNEYSRTREMDRERAGVKPEDEFETPELYKEYLENNDYLLMPPDTPEADFLLKTGERIAFELAKTNPLAALEWAKSLAVGIMQAHSVSGALSGWSTWAPQEAVNFYLQHYAYDPVIPMYLFENWAKQDQDTAAAAIKGLPNASQQASAIQGLTTGWLDSGDNLAGLVAWVGQLEPGTSRDNAHQAIIDHSSGDNPVGAWELVTRISDPSLRMRSAQEVLSLLAANDPAIARQMLERYPAPRPEMEALQRILAQAE